MNTIPVHEISFNKLYLINLLNNAGCDNKPVKFETLYEAQKSCSPILASIVKKLNDKEIKSLIDRIENII